MRIAVIPDSFKEGPDASLVANAIEEGIMRASPQFFIRKLPFADGGNGFLEILNTGLKGKYVEVKSCDPLNREIITRYGVINHTTAVIESAMTCGLNLVAKNERDPTKTTSYGLGIVLNDVIRNGYKNILLGLGGSATNDAGVGMLQALGFKFLDIDRKEIGRGGVELKKIKTIEKSQAHDFANLDITVACNPSSFLCGPEGTSYKYGKQKGATDEQVILLDNLLSQYALLTHHYTGVDVLSTPGVGGAGGIGASLLAYLNARLVHSIDVMKEYLPIEETIISSDIVISAEGKFDEQSVNGKVCGEIAKIAKKYRKPMFMLCGQIGENVRAPHRLFDGIFCISSGPKTLEESIRYSVIDLMRTAESLGRTISAISWRY